jgi:hypothetical protein
MGNRCHYLDCYITIRMSKPRLTLRLFYVIWQAVDYWLEQEENTNESYDGKENKKNIKDMEDAQDWCRTYILWWEYYHGKLK